MPRNALGIRKATEDCRRLSVRETTIARKTCDLIQLIYVSAAAPGLTQADLEAIERSSLAHNRTAGITGLLLHQGDMFSGTLEGPERKVLARMEVIIRDPRHARVRVLRESSISERRFENWSFGTLPHVTDGTDHGRSFILALSRGPR